MTSEFVDGVKVWRLSQVLPSSIELVCPNCKLVSTLDEMHGRPHFAFSKGAIVFSGVENIHVSERLDSELSEVFGSTKPILRRVG